MYYLTPFSVGLLLWPLSLPAIPPRHQGFTLGRPTKDFRTHFPAVVQKVSKGKQAQLHGVEKNMHVHELNGEVVRDKSLSWVQKTLKKHKSEKLPMTITFMKGKPSNESENPGENQNQSKEQREKHQK
jgi:hypothetical protein